MASKKTSSRKRAGAKGAASGGEKKAPGRAVSPPKPGSARKSLPAEAPSKDAKIIITPELRRIWLNIRRAWVTSYDAFKNSLAVLDDRQSNELYNVIRHALFKNSYVEILREHPELRELVKSDDDRMCMYDIYEHLSWRLRRSEEPPRDIKLRNAFKSRVGRAMPDFST